MSDYVNIEFKDTHIYPTYRKAAHAFIFTKVDQKQHQFEVLLNLRFDGYYGFPGGFLEQKETEFCGLNRELKEEINIVKPLFNASHLIKVEINHKMKLILYSYAIILDEHAFKELEENTFYAEDMGKETLGVISMPIRNVDGINKLASTSFIGNAKSQLFDVITKLNILVNIPSFTSIQNDETAGCHKLALALYVFTERKLFNTISINAYLLTFIDSDLKCVLPTFYGQSKDEIRLKVNAFFKYMQMNTIEIDQEIRFDNILYGRMRNDEYFLKDICRHAYSWAKTQKSYIGVVCLGAFDVNREGKTYGLSYFIHNQAVDYDVITAMENIVKLQSKPFKIL